MKHSSYLAINKSFQKIKLIFYIAEQEVEMRYGTWSERYDEDDYIFFRKKFVCSACGKWNTYGKTSFCPICGADMRGIDPALKAVMDVVLEDDDTDCGGVGFAGETVWDFVSSTWRESDAIKTVDELNKALIACGIKPVNLQKEE